MTTSSGIVTSTLVVPVSSRSFGTRNVSLVKLPCGASLGSTVTCAAAGDANTKIAIAATTAANTPRFEPNTLAPIAPKASCTSSCHAVVAARRLRVPRISRRLAGRSWKHAAVPKIYFDERIAALYDATSSDMFEPGSSNPRSTSSPGSRAAALRSNWASGPAASRCRSAGAAFVCTASISRRPWSSDCARSLVPKASK